jgi:hypothetical protein
VVEKLSSGEWKKPFFVGGLSFLPVNQENSKGLKSSQEIEPLGDTDAVAIQSVVLATLRSGEKFDDSQVFWLPPKGALPKRTPFADNVKGGRFTITSPSKVSGIHDSTGNLYTPHARAAKPRPSVDKGSQSKSKKNSGNTNAKQQAKKKPQAKFSTISVYDSSSSSEEDSEPPPKLHKQIEKNCGKGKRGYSDFTNTSSFSLQHEQQPEVSVGTKFQRVVSQEESDSRVEAAAAQEKAKGSERVVGIYEKFFEKGELKAEAQVAALRTDAAAQAAAAEKATALSREHELKLLHEFGPPRSGNYVAAPQPSRSPPPMSVPAASKPMGLSEAVEQSKKLIDEAGKLEISAQAQTESDVARTLLLDAARNMKLEAQKIVSSAII